MNEPVEYPGKDLEAMDIAGAYRRWILDGFRPFLGKRIVERDSGRDSRPSDCPAACEREGER